MKTPYQNFNLVPVINVPHDQYSYINLIVNDLLEILDNKKTLWVLPGGSLDLILTIYNIKPDILNWLNIHIIEINKQVYDMYELLKIDVEKFISAQTNTKNINKVCAYKVHSLLNLKNISLSLCETSIDKFLINQQEQFHEDDLVFINTSTREQQQEFSADILLNIAYDRLVLGLPSIFIGCTSLKLRNELEGSSTTNKEFYVDRALTPSSKMQSILSVHSFT